MSLQYYRTKAGGQYIVNEDFTMKYIPPKIRTQETHAIDMLTFFQDIAPRAESVVSPAGKAKFQEEFLKEHDDALLEFNLTNWARSLKNK